jgi:hypothetical protein
MTEKAATPLVRLVSQIGDNSSDPSTVEGFNALVLATQGLFEFPQCAVLLWSGCTRQSEPYRFPAGLQAKWKGRRSGRLDYRMQNGPPNSAFTLGGGKKPSGWELDHIYDEEPLWSVRKGLHFTQSAGLVAMPRHAHRRRHSDSMLSWLVRGIAFLKFGYDPLTAFSKGSHDKFGFIVGKSCEVFGTGPTIDVAGNQSTFANSHQEVVPGPTVPNA